MEFKSNKDKVRVIEIKSKKDKVTAIQFKKNKKSKVTAMEL